MMNAVYINGIGLLTAGAQSVAELVAILQGKQENNLMPGKEFSMGVPSSKVRRCSRYVKLAVASSVQAVNDFGGLSGIEPERIGSLLSTGYGPVESNIGFSDDVMEAKPSICSPATFSYIVPNACLGQICIVNKLKGPSTMFYGGDVLEYGTLLLQTDKADVVLCGALEEYNDELKASFKKADILNQTRLGEAATTLMLSKEKRPGSYAKITAFSSGAFRMYPYVHKLPADEIYQDMGEALADIKDTTPDIIFTQTNGSYFDAIENRVLKKKFPAAELYAYKELYGEVLGADYLTAVATAAIILKEGTFKGRKVKKIMATGIDVQGDYLSCLVEAV